MRAALAAEITDGRSDSTRKGWGRGPSEKDALAAYPAPAMREFLSADRNAVSASLSQKSGVFCHSWGADAGARIARISVGRQKFDLRVVEPTTAISVARDGVVRLGPPPEPVLRHDLPAEREAVHVRAAPPIAVLVVM